MTPLKTTLMVVLGAAAAGCATVAAEPDYRQAALALLKQDFRSKGPATLERVITQDEAQQLCSQYPQERPAEVAARIEATQMKNIRQPADGKYLGDWKEGEKVAQNGRGMQSSDKVGGINGGNCYACHQISKQEISFGNIGPSLYNYGKIRGSSDEMLKYTWGKIYNAQAFTACSNMPRFGHSGILTEAQLKDVMALLMDPASPVNQ
ncbi:MULTISPECIES: sulfur oxidation c-type cytochrome SoxX [Massilia]|jgi:sulfur-oxidizing protein SoxX|uniref:sulfur oxidation c-type cytochrome SoxX n=1 Tax=Massilia TaxID=149698 RepID=UPI00235452B7|nr:MULTISPECIES: sulfur oxidation c-type cytochrome SoxX [Massilia]MDN4038937.1 sulfur oxidation c-type cytochrome SoxX [Massilia sp. YIM B02443]